MNEVQKHEQYFQHLLRKMRRVTRATAFEHRLNSTELCSLLLAYASDWRSLAKVLDYNTHIFHLSVDDHHRKVEALLARLAYSPTFSVALHEDALNELDEYDLDLRHNQSTLEVNSNNITFAPEDSAGGQRFQLLSSKFDPGQFEGQLCNNITYNGVSDMILDHYDDFAEEVRLPEEATEVILPEGILSYDPNVEECDTLQVSSAIQEQLDLHPHVKDEPDSLGSEPEQDPHQYESEPQNAFELRADSIQDFNDVYTEVFSTVPEPPGVPPPLRGVSARHSVTARRRVIPAKPALYTRSRRPQVSSIRLTWQYTHELEDLFEDSVAGPLRFDKQELDQTDYQIHELIFRRSLIREEAIRAQPSKQLRANAQRFTSPGRSELKQEPEEEHSQEEEPYQLKEERPEEQTPREEESNEQAFAVNFEEAPDWEPYLPSLSLKQALQLDQLRDINIDSNFQFVAGGRSLSVEALKDVIRHELEETSCRFQDILTAIAREFRSPEQVKNLSIHTCFITLLFVTNQEQLKLKPVSHGLSNDFLVSRK